MGQCPQARVDLRVVDLGSELMVCDDRKRLVHILNSTARRIWDLCDGTHQIDEISLEVSRLFPEQSPEVVRRDVESALTALGENEMIAWVGEARQAQD